MKTLSGSDLQYFEILLTESIKLLKSNLGWLTSLSNKQRICWGILASTCSRINISDKMDWIHHYCSIFPSEPKLGMVFSSFCAKKRLSKDQCIVKKNFLEGLQFSTQDILKYVVFTMTSYIVIPFAQAPGPESRFESGSQSIWERWSESGFESSLPPCKHNRSRSGSESPCIRKWGCFPHNCMLDRLYKDASKAKH